MRGSLGMGDVVAWIAAAVVIAAAWAWPLYALGVAVGLAVVVAVVVVIVLAMARRGERRAALRLAEDQAKARVDPAEGEPEEGEPEPDRVWLVSVDGHVIDDRGRWV